MVLSGHKGKISYINSYLNPLNELTIVTISEDKTIKIWSIYNEYII